MSLFFAMGDACLFCSQSKNKQDKANHKYNLYAQSADVLREASDSCDMELISHDDYKGVWASITRLRLMCTECDMKDALVHNFVNKEVSIPIGDDLKEKDKEEKQSKEAILAKLGVKKEGNVYRTDFSKARKKEGSVR